MKKILLVLAIVLCISQLSMATMSWQRGDAGSTWQDWKFNTNANPAAPEAFSNPYGAPVAYMVTGPGLHFGAAGSNATLFGRKGIWAGGSVTIDLIIPNTPIENPYKEVWLEVGYTAIQNALSLTAGNNMVVDIGQTVMTGADGWSTLLQGWRIYPNPASEDIHLWFEGTGGYVDYIKVDTICIPEPATIAMLGLGTIALLRKRVA
jgi:hypothetical protein